MTVHADPLGMVSARPELPGMNDVDPGLRQHIIGIRNRFGLDGLRDAHRLIAEQIAKFEHAYDDLASL